MSIIDKIKDWLGKNPDKANSAIDKVGDLVDKRTQGKYAQHVDKVQDAARKNIAKGTPGASPTPPPNTPPPPAAPPTPPPAPTQ